jgi:hypothetical protein
MTETKKLLEEHWEELMDNLKANPALTKVLKDSFYNGAMVTLEALRVVGRDSRRFSRILFTTGPWSRSKLSGWLAGMLFLLRSRNI